MPRRSTGSTSRSTPSLRRLPLGSLRVFVAIGEHLSFSRAADAIGVSTAAVSMQLRALEEYLRVPLFRRNGRRVALTAEGEMLLPRVRRALEELEFSLEAMRSARRTGHVTVSMLPSFLQQWLLPRLPDFQAKHPEIDLRIETSRTLTDFLRSDVQVAIRLGVGPWPNVFVEKLLDEWLVPACTPEMLRRLGPVETTEDLKRYRLLQVNNESWSAWPNGKSMRGWASSGSSMDDSVAAVRAAAAGHGLVLARWSLAADDVAAGRLALASSKRVKYEGAYFFVCPEPYLDIDKIAIFRQWLQQQARAFALPPS